MAKVRPLRMSAVVKENGVNGSPKAITIVTMLNTTTSKVAPRSIRP
jgi:hypothetical protein